MRGLLVALALAAVSVVGPPTAAAAPVAAPANAVCSGSSVGPGIAPPDRVPLGIPGFHASWYGQSGYPTLCPGERSNAVVAFYNSGSRGWVAGRMGEVAYLGTWNGDPGQDEPTVLGGNGEMGSPQTGWPRFNRVATQPSDYVGPGQVAWFQFSQRIPWWSADTPAGSWIEVEIQARTAAGRETRWWRMGIWAYGDETIRRTSVGGQSDADGVVETDTFKTSAEKMTAYRARVTLSRTTAAGATPVLRRIYAVVSDTRSY